MRRRSAAGWYDSAKKSTIQSYDFVSKVVPQ
jgi:hypothetical protein